MVDHALEIRSAIPELALLSSAARRDLIIDIWREAWEQSDWENLEDIPKNPDAPSTPEHVPNGWTLVAHTRAVAKLAVDCAEVLTKIHGVMIERDDLLTIALLHDVSKVVEYSGTRTSIEKNEFGRLIQHGAYGAFQIWKRGLPVEIVHGVLAHTPQSRTVPRTLEALIVRYVDFLDTDVALLDAGKEITLQ